MQNKPSYTILFSLVLIVIIAGLAAAMIVTNSKMNKTVDQITITTDQANPNKQTELTTQTQPITYLYQEIFENGNYDAKIINQASLQAVIPSTKELCGLYTDLLVNLPRLEKDLTAAWTDQGIFFTQRAVPDTDSPRHDLYKITTNPASCVHMQSGSLLTGFASIQISPDLTKLAVVTEDAPRVLTLIDLKTDTSKTLVTLTTTETFNGGIGGLSSEFKISWLNNNTIQYTVFREIQFTVGSKPVLRKNTVTIQ